MKKLLLLSILILSLGSCGSRDKTQVEMDRSFRAYIKTNDSIKHYKTKIQYIKTLSYEKQGANEDEYYKARVHFTATTSYEGSHRIYNIDDTVVAYFDENVNMVRMINPTDN